LVTEAVPLVSRLMAVVELPPEGSARSGVFLNCRYASISKYLRASSLSVLSMIAVIWCLASAVSLPV